MAEAPPTPKRRIGRPRVAEPRCRKAYPNFTEREYVWLQQQARIHGQSVNELIRDIVADAAAEFAEGESPLALSRTPKPSTRPH